MFRIITLLAALMTLAGTASAEMLTLKDCLTSASANNRGLKAAVRDVRIAQEQIEIAKSGLRPRVDVQGGYTAQLAPQAVSFPASASGSASSGRTGGAGFETQDADFPFFSLSIYDTLWDFGRTRAREGQALMQREAVRNMYSASEQDIFLQVVKTYYGILTAQKLVTAANDEVAQMLSHQKTAQALFEEGVVTRNDLLQAEVRVAASRQRLISAQSAVDNGWLALNYLIGQPADFRGQLQEDAQLPGFTATTAEPDLSNRGEVAALKNTVAAREYEVKEAKTNYYPEIFVKLGLDYVENSKVREQAMMAGTVGLKVNLFDGLATTSRLRQAVEARSRDEEKLRDLEERVKLELATAQNDMRVAGARIKVAETAIAQGVENLRITRDRYIEKVGTATDVVDATTLLTQTRTDYYQSIYDLEVAAARVKRATGNL
jgi:outer membrane protein